LSWGKEWRDALNNPANYEGRIPWIDLKSGEPEWSIVSCEIQFLNKAIILQLYLLKLKGPEGALSFESGSLIEFGSARFYSH
jgi:hypothetical protein